MDFDYEAFMDLTDRNVLTQRTIFLEYLNNLKLIELLKTYMLQGHQNNIYELSLVLRDYSRTNCFHAIANLFDYIHDHYNSVQELDFGELFEELDYEYSNVVGIIRRLLLSGTH